MPAKPKSMVDWKAIIEAQHASGLTVKAYCEQHHLNIKTFRARKSNLNLNRTNHEKAPSKPSKNNGDFIAVSRLASASNNITLICGNTNLSLPESISSDWLAQLIKALNT